MCRWCCYRLLGVKINALCGGQGVCVCVCLFVCVSARAGVGVGAGRRCGRGVGVGVGVVWAWAWAWARARVWVGVWLGGSLHGRVGGVSVSLCVCVCLRVPVSYRMVCYCLVVSGCRLRGVLQEAHPGGEWAVSWWSIYYMLL